MIKRNAFKAALLAPALLGAVGPLFAAPPLASAEEQPRMPPATDRPRGFGRAVPELKAILTYA